MIKLVEQYINTGDTSYLKRLGYSCQILVDIKALIKSLPKKNKFTTRDKRIIHVVHSVSMHQLLTEWFRKKLIHEKPEDDYTGILVEELVFAGCEHEAILKLIFDTKTYLTDGLPNSACRYLRQQSQDALIRAMLYTLNFVNYIPFSTPPLINAIGHLRVFINLISTSRNDADFYFGLCTTYEELIIGIAKQKPVYNRFCIYDDLETIYPGKYTEKALQAARESLAEGSYPLDISEWLIDKYSMEYLPEILESIENGNGWGKYGHCDLMKFSVKKLRGKSESIILKCMEVSEYTSFWALFYLIKLKKKRNYDTIKSRLLDGFRDTHPLNLMAYIEMAAEWDIHAVENEVRELLKSEDKNVSLAAAKALSKLDDQDPD